MNSHRLSRLTGLIAEELTKAQTVKLMGQLVNNLQSAINGPTEATQRSVEDLRTRLATNLEKAPSIDFSPGTREELSELAIEDTEVSDLLGAGLLARLNEALGTGYTSVKTLDAVKLINDEVNALHTAIQSLRQGLSQLSIEDDDLEPGDSIVGMTIPRTEVDGVTELRAELHVFGLFVSQMTEAIRGTAKDPEVRTLRSSGFGIDLSADLDVVAAVAFAIRGIKYALDKLQRFRDLKRQMEALQVDPKTIAAIDKQSEASMEKDLDDLEIEIANEFKYNDQGRPKELRTAVRVNLNRVANRMERGFIFEARTQIPADPTPEQMQQAAVVESLSSVRFEAIEGPRLLQLPEEAEPTPKAAPADSNRPARKKKSS